MRRTRKSYRRSWDCDVQVVERGISQTVYVKLEVGMIKCGFLGAFGPGAEKTTEE